MHRTDAGDARAAARRPSLDHTARPGPSTTIGGDGLIIRVMPEASDVGLVDLGEPPAWSDSAIGVVDRPHAGGARRSARPGCVAVSGPAIRPRWRLERAGGRGRALVGRVGGLTLELRPTDGGQVGLFPEHAAMLPWLGARWPSASAPAATGSSTCSPTRAWRRSRWPAPALPSPTSTPRGRRSPGRGATPRSPGLADRPIRWIVDDARDLHGARGPSRPALRRASCWTRRRTGTAPDGRPWRLETTCEPLLADCSRDPRAGRVRPADGPHARVRWRPAAPRAGTRDGAAPAGRRGRRPGLDDARRPPARARVRSRGSPARA